MRRTTPMRRGAGKGGGNKPTPTHLKLVAGTMKPSRVNKDEPKPPLFIPEPPPELSEEALEEWHKISKRLLAAGILTALDRAVLAAYCQAYGRWAQAERALAEVAKQNPRISGLMIKTTNGNFVQNPLVGTANRAMGDMVQYAAELGMTPSSRQRVRATLHLDHGNTTDEFFDS